MRYKLYALENTTEAHEFAVKNVFVRITKDYVLIYKTGKKPENSAIVKGEDLSRLTDQDKEWLEDCNFQILLKNAKENEKAIATSMAEKIDELEKRLKEEQEKSEWGE